MLFDVKCPVCEKNMERGTLLTGGGSGIFYLPEKRNGLSLPGFFKVNKKKLEKQGGVVLDGPYLTCFSEPSCSVWRCSSCRKIVIDY